MFSSLGLPRRDVTHAGTYNRGFLQSCKCLNKLSAITVHPIGFTKLIFRLEQCQVFYRTDQLPDEKGNLFLSMEVMGLPRVTYRFSNVANTGANFGWVLFVTPH